MKVQQSDDSVTYIDFGNDIRQGIDILWVSDAHLDSHKSNRVWLKQQFDGHPDAYIIIGGDLFDVMQNVKDPRSSKAAIKEEHNKPGYLNAVIDDVYNFLKEYAPRIIQINIGNHETAQVKHYGIDLSDWLVAKLNENCGTNIIKGDFNGYILIRGSLDINDDIKKANVKHGTIYYQHKPVTGGSRSKGALSIDIMKGVVPSADLIISEDIHQTFLFPFIVETINKITKKREYTLKHYIQNTTLKEDYLGVKRGYHAEKNFTPSVTGIIKINVKGIYKTSGLQFEPEYIYKR